MLKNRLYLKNLLLFSVLVGIGGCNLSSEYMSFKAAFGRPAVKSLATKCQLLQKNQ